MFWLVIGAVYALFILGLFVRGQLKVKDIPGPKGPIIVGAVGALVLLLNAWMFHPAVPVIGYLIVSAIIGIGAGGLRGALSRVHYAPDPHRIVRRGGWIGAGIFIAGLTLHFSAETLFAPHAPVLVYPSGRTFNVYIAATLASAGMILRARARRLISAGQLPAGVPVHS